jgi:hypothetical protein
VSSVEGATNNGEWIMTTTRTVRYGNLNVVADTLWSALGNDSGCTVSPAGERVEPTSGYAVSVAGAELRTSYRPSFGIVRGWLQDAAAHVSAQSLYGRDANFGAWCDTDAGHWYLDVSVVVDSLDEALELGRKHNQLAVWSFADAAAIECHPAAVVVKNVRH